MEKLRKLNIVFKGLLLYAVCLFLLLGMSATAQWVGPTVVPPGGNAPPPINVGAVSQIKSGPLGVGGVFHAYDNVYIDGRLGVGTEALYAGAQVTIEGDRVVLQNPGNGITTIEISPSISDATKLWKIGADSGGSIHIANSAGIPAGAKMTFKNDGSIGVGTTNPQARLHVVGDSTSPPFALFDNLIVVDDGSFGKNLLPNWQLESTTHWDVPPSQPDRLNGPFIITGTSGGPNVYFQNAAVNGGCSAKRLFTTYIPVDYSKGYEATVWTSADTGINPRWGFVQYNANKTVIIDNKTNAAGEFIFGAGALTASNWTKRSAYILPYTSVANCQAPAYASGTCVSSQTTDLSRCFNCVTSNPVRYIRLWYDACQGSSPSGNARFTMPTLKEINPGQNYFSGALISDSVRSDTFCDKSGVTCKTFAQLSDRCVNVPYAELSGLERWRPGWVSPAPIIQSTLCPSGFLATNTGSVPAVGELNCCKFTAGGGPPPSYRLVGGLHTMANCVDGGGTPVNSSGAATLVEADAYFCRFGLANCPVGWTQHLQWSTTVPATCTSTTACTTAAHTWASALIEQCTYKVAFLTRYCTALRTQVGCF